MSSERSMRIARGRSEVANLPLLATEPGHYPVDLSDNTNLWGAPPAALRALRELDAESLARYPAIYSEPLQASLLDYAGLGAESGIGVVTGCGSDDILDSTMRAFGGAGDAIAYSSPTFSMIPVLARLNGLVPHAIPFTNEMDIDAERLVDTRAAITYVCTPNNPTGTAASRAAVEYVAAHAVGLVLLDEAYVEFAPETFVDLAAKHERVLIARTFSKAFGLAGLRVGYGVGSREATTLVTRARGPYKVNAVAERVVLATLRDEEHGVGWVRRHASLAIENRNRLITELRIRGLVVMPSDANFIMIASPRARVFSGALGARGILVRLITGLPESPSTLAHAGGCALRIGVGPWLVMEALLGALLEVLECE